MAITMKKTLLITSAVCLATFLTSFSEPVNIKKSDIKTLSSSSNDVPHYGITIMSRSAYETKEYKVNNDTWENFHPYDIPVGKLTQLYFLTLGDKGECSENCKPYFKVVLDGSLPDQKYSLDYSEGDIPLLLLPKTDGFKYYKPNTFFALFEYQGNNIRNLLNIFTNPIPGITPVKGTEESKDITAVFGYNADYTQWGVTFVKNK